MLKFLMKKVRNFDYFNLGNSFALYYLFIFFGLPLVYLVGARAVYLDSLLAHASISGGIAVILILGLLSFAIGYRAMKPRERWTTRLGLHKQWKEKNTTWTFAALLAITLAGKIVMFLNGHYLISFRIFHLEPLFGSVNSTGFGQFTGYFAIPGFALLALAFTRCFELKKQGNASHKVWRKISWALLILEVGSGLLTGNRLPVITAIMLYAVVRHYAYKKSWKHFIAVVVFSVIVIMPAGSFFERPGDMLSALKTSKPGQIVLDTTMGRFSQNVVISSIIKKTEHYSYGKNLLNFFVSLGPPRFIWKDKPVISFQGNKFGREYGVINDFDFNTNVGPTIVGDLYMNFGFWGIIGGLFAFGLIFRFLFDLLISFPARAPGGVLIYAVLWPDLIKGMENDVASVLAGAVKLAIFMYCIHLCLTADWRRLITRVASFWRPLVLGVFIWMFIGDAIRKLIPTQPWQLMLVLDIIVGLTYFLFVIDCVKNKKFLWRPPFLVPILVFSAIFLWSALGPYSTGFGAAAVGFRNYLWFVPLMFLGYEMFDSKEQVLKFCRVLSCIAIPLFILAGIQQVFHNTDITLLNPFAEGHRVRSGDINLVSSVFGSAQRFGMVSMFLFFLGIAARSPATLFAFASVMLSGSRSAFVLSVFGFIALLFFGKKQFFGKASSVKIAVGILAVIVLLWSVPSFRDTISFQVKEGIPMIGKSRIGIFAGEMREVWGNHFSWFGRGAGAFSQGVRYVGKEQALSYEKSLGETGIRNLLLELGVIGLVAFYVMWASVLYAMVKTWK
ncbi:MAG: O-antigen polymerase, partial [Nanoarchaeota archaeon]|nr:O-antigen polymerase [Nanoarchaeota archaeon]